MADGLVASNSVCMHTWKMGSIGIRKCTGNSVFGAAGYSGTCPEVATAALRYIEAAVASHFASKERQNLQHINRSS